MTHNRRTSAFISIFTTLALISTMLFHAIPDARASVPNATIAYLAHSAPSDWIIMAQSALGQTPENTDFLKTIDGESANDYATYILAITGLGENPRTFGSVDYVAALQSKNINGQLGDEAYMSDDIFGVLALRAAGASIADSLMVQEINYIKSMQRANGGWNWSTFGTDTNVDYTAMALMALYAGGVHTADSAIGSALTYLAGAQNADAGFGLVLGEASNTASTAWVLSALSALGEDMNFWTQSNNTPADYLLAQFSDEGYSYHTTAHENPTAFAPTETAYAAIALAGKYYPLHIAIAPPGVAIRIEGAANTLCEASVSAATALDAVKSAATVCGYAYTIQDTTYGPYLTAIANEVAAGMDGWSYLVNDARANVGAADYTLQPNDQVLWYYGAWDQPILRLTHTKIHPGKNSTTTAFVEQLTDTLWVNAENAIIHQGTTAVPVVDGTAILSWTQDGAYELRATNNSSIRSNRIFITIGNTAENTTLPVSVVIGNNQTQELPPPTEEPTDNTPITFGVSGNLDFGTLSPGQSATRSATITAKGNAVLVTATMQGASLFNTVLKLDNASVPVWRKSLASGASEPIAVSVSIPHTEATSGALSGSLIFWATPIR